MILLKFLLMNRLLFLFGVFNVGGMDGGVDVKFGGIILCGEKMLFGNVL